MTLTEYMRICNSDEETRRLAEEIGSRVIPGSVIALEGDLGAGKTTFSKGIAKSIGVTRNVNSPTFTIMKEYKGKLPLYHMDVYRIENEEEDFGFEEYFEGEGITIVEWAHLIKGQLPQELLTLYLYHEGNDSRKIIAEPKGEFYEKLCEEIFQ